MALKRYSCQAYPNLRIGNQIKFNMGFFETESEFLQDMIKRNDLWDARIFEIPVIEDVPLPRAPKIPEMDSAVDAVMGDADVDFELEEAPGEAEEEEIAADDPELVEEFDPTPTEPWNQGISATDINKMRVADLDSLAIEIGAELEDPDAPRTKNRLTRAIRLKLGV